MPLILLLLLLALTFPLAAQDKSAAVSGTSATPAQAPQATPPPKPVDPTDSSASNSEVAPTRYPERYMSLIREATRCYHARDFEGALRYVDLAETIIPPAPYSINVRGAVATEQHRFKEGRDYFIEALVLNPNFFEAKFNLSEIPFIQGKYAEARAGFEKLLLKEPKNELLIYRIYLTYLMEKNDDAAKTWRDKIPFPSETPSYHYANAAWEYAHGNKEKAEEWIESGEWVWPEAKRANFVDVLIHIGWVEFNDPNRIEASENQPASLEEKK